MPAPPGAEGHKRACAALPGDKDCLHSCFSCSLLLRLLWLAWEMFAITLSFRVTGAHRTRDFKQNLGDFNFSSVSHVTLGFSVRTDVPGAFPLWRRGAFEAALQPAVPPSSALRAEWLRISGAPRQENPSPGSEVLSKDLFAQLSVPVKEHLPSLVLVLNLASSTSILCFPVSYLSLSSHPDGSAVPLRIFRLSTRCSALPARMALTAHSRAALSLLCFPGLYLDLGWKRHRVFKIRYKVQFPVILLALTPVDRRLSEERLSWCQGHVLGRVCSWHSSMQIISCGTWPCRGGCHKHTESVEFPVQPLFKVGELRLGYMCLRC